MTVRHEGLPVRLRVMLLTAACLLCSLAGTARAQGTWVEVERYEPLVGSRSSDDVKRDALYGAIAEAVRRVAGVRVQGTEFSSRTDSAGRVVDHYAEAVRLDAAGRATGWTVVKEEWSAAKPGTKGAAVVYHLMVRVRVEREAGTADAGFTVRVQPNSDRLRVRGADLKGNDELVARITATKRATLTVVIIVDDSVFVLAPSAYVEAPEAAPGATVEVPDAASREAGIRFRAALPAGVASRSELLAVVATLRPVPLMSGAGNGQGRDTGVLTLGEFNKWLVGIPLDQRAVAQVAIEVQKVP